MDAGSGYNAQSNLPVHFALPVAMSVDVEVIWPAGGERRVTRERNVRVDGRRVITLRAR